MADVFCSYKRDDRAKVERFVQLLERAGYAVWWDPTILPGERFSAAIRKALDQTKCVVVCWSAKSIDSVWVNDEASVGLERNILVPVSLDGVRPPLGFRQLHTINLTGWSDAYDDPRSKQILQGIERIAGRPNRLEFTPCGDDVLLELPLTIDEAVVGAHVDVPTYYGPTVVLDIPAGTSSGVTFSLPGRGSKNPTTGIRGAQIVKAHIVMPDTIDDKLRYFMSEWRQSRRYSSAIGNDMRVKCSRDDTCVELPITIDEAVLGYRAVVSTPAGDNGSLAISEGAKSGYILWSNEPGVRGPASGLINRVPVKARIILPDVVDEKLTYFLMEWRQRHRYFPRH